MFKNKAVSTPTDNIISIQAEQPEKNNSKKTKADLPSTVSEAVNGILNICGIIIFFYIVINIFLEILAAIPFIANNSAVYYAVKVAASGFLEISSGIYSLVNINLPVAQKLIIASIILAWSGVSVHVQIMYVLKDTGLSLKPYFTGKIIHVIISSVLIKILFSFNAIAKMCKADYIQIARFNGYNSYAASLVLTGIVSGIILLVVIAAALGYRIYEARRKS